MDPEKNEPRPFDPEDTGDLDIPPQMRKAAEQAVYGNTPHPFDSEVTGEYQAEFNLLDQKLQNDSLAADRELDMQRLAPIVSDKSGAFHQSVLDDRDHEAEKRLTQYEVEKDYNAAPKEEFYQKTGLDPSGEEAARLTEQQKILLNTVQKLSDGIGFQEVHPDLNRNDILRPTSAPLDEIRPAAAQMEEVVIPGTATGLDGVGVQAVMTYDKYQVLTGQKDATDLLERDKAPHPVASVDRDSLRRRSQPISTEMMLGLGLVVLAVPLFGWSIYNQTHANADADRIQTEQSVALASESADKHSMANQMEEPYRMPAGQVGPLGGGGSYSRDGNKAAPETVQGELASWKPPAHPTPEPTGQQLAQNRKLLAQADQMEALGNTTQAAALLNGALTGCPGDISLVMATARKYMSVRDYATARNIIQAAMRGARTLQDYSLLLQVLNSIPKT